MKLLEVIEMRLPKLSPNRVHHYLKSHHAPSLCCDRTTYLSRDCSGAVAAAVVDDNQLPCGVRLCQHRLDALFFFFFFCFFLFCC
jgi:hypothetical protein